MDYMAKNTFLDFVYHSERVLDELIHHHDDRERKINLTLKEEDRQELISINNFMWHLHNDIKRGEYEN